MALQPTLSPDELITLHTDEFLFLQTKPCSLLISHLSRATHRPLFFLRLSTNHNGKQNLWHKSEQLNDEYALAVLISLIAGEYVHIMLLWYELIASLLVPKYVDDSIRRMDTALNGLMQVEIAMVSHA